MRDVLLRTALLPLILKAGKGTVKQMADRPSGAPRPAGARGEKTHAGAVIYSPAPACYSESIQLVCSSRRCFMPRAIVDPAELRRFAHSLKHFSNELSHQMAVLQGQFG